VSVGSGSVLINYYSLPSLTISHELQYCGETTADLVVSVEKQASVKDCTTPADKVLRHAPPGYLASQYLPINIISSVDLVFDILRQETGMGASGHVYINCSFARAAEPKSKNCLAKRPATVSDGMRSRWG
jgi:hypothetical protein